MFLLAGFCLPFSGLAMRAAETSNATKGGAWLLGDNLSLAVLLYNQGAAPASVNQVLSKAKAIADILGMEIKPFPAKSGTAAAASADMIHYLIEGDGTLIGPALTRKYDAEHGTPFEVAVKSNLLILLYAPVTAPGNQSPLSSRLDWSRSACRPRCGPTLLCGSTTSAPRAK